jgi:hypothetical protein
MSDLHSTGETRDQSQSQQVSPRKPLAARPQVRFALKLTMHASGASFLFTKRLCLPLGGE